MPSTTRPQHENSPQARPAPEPLVIEDWPLRDRPLGSSLALALAAGATWLAVWATHSGIAGAAVAVLLLLTLWRTWLPVRYELGAGGILQSCLGRKRHISWSAVRGHELRSDGIILLPDPASTAGALRGLYVHWGGHREAVLARLEYYLLPRGRSISGSSIGSAGL